MFSPSSCEQVKARRLDSELGVDDESENGLILPVDTNARRDVVAEGQLGR